MFINLLWMVLANIVVQLLSPAKVQNAKPIGLAEVDIPTADETRPLPMIFGTVPVAGNVIWYGDYRASGVTQRVRVSMFKKKNQTIGYEYAIGLWLSLTAAACDSVEQILLGDHVVWSGSQALSHTTSTDLAVNTRWTVQEGQEVRDGMAGTFRFYATTRPDSTAAFSYPTNAYMVARTEGSVPAYPNTTHAVWLGPSDASGGLVGSSPNLQPLRIALKRLPALGSFLTSADYRLAGLPPAFLVGGSATAYAQSISDISGDANPAFTIAELLVTRVPGVGPRLTPFGLNPASFLACAAVLHAEGNGCSFAWESTRPVSEVIDDLLRQIAGQFEYDEATATIGLRLIRETDEVVEVFNDSNILRISESSQVLPTEAVNLVRVSYSDRARNYQPATATAKNNAALIAAGAEIVRDVQYIGVSNHTLAAQLADRDLRAASTPLWQIRFEAAMLSSTMRRPGDVITVPGPSGAALRCRIASIRYGDYSSRTTAEIEAVEDIFRSGSAGAAAAPTAPSVDTTTPPSALVSPVLTVAPYALTGSDADTLLYYAQDPDAATTGYQFAIKEGATYWSPTVPTEHAAERDEPAISGTLGAVLASTASSPTLTLTVSAAAAEQFSRNPRGSVYAIVGNEWMSLAGFTLSGLTLVVSNVQRGIFDTVPGRHAAGAVVVLLLGYTVDVGQVYTTVAAGQTLPGITLARARAESHGPAGVLSADSAASSEAVWNYSSYSCRAPLPLPPAYVRLAGVSGALDAADTAPSISRSASLTLTWVNRDRTLRLAHGYYETEQRPEATGYLSCSAEYETTPGTWVPFVSWTNQAVGANSAAISMSLLMAGARRVRVYVIARRTVGGAVVSSAGVVYAYWTVSA